MTENSVSDDAAPFLGTDWFDPVEAGVRQRIRGFIEDLALATAVPVAVNRAPDTLVPAPL